MKRLTVPSLVGLALGLYACGAEPLGEGDIGSETLALQRATERPAGDPVIAPPRGDGPRGPAEPRPFPPRPRPPAPPEPTTNYCPLVHPECLISPAAFDPRIRFEADLQAAGCRTPVHYATNNPRDYPFIKATLCWDTQRVRDLVQAQGGGGFSSPVFSRVACDRCLPAPPAGAMYVFYRRFDVLGPLCPSNCIDTPWDETQPPF